MKQHTPLTTAEEIAATHLPDGAVALWWLGQAGFALRSSTLTLYLDPYLSASPHRLVPPPITAESSPPVDYVLCTHEHTDHLDVPTVKALAQVSPHTRFVVPSPIIGQLITAGIADDRILGVQPDEEHQLDATTRLIPVAAVHGLDCPPAVYDFGLTESGGLFRYLGYVIDFHGLRIYHAGDTLVYDGLAERLRALDIDIALLPINGRSYFREQMHLVGNLDEREAADLAAAAAVKLLIPIHYEMFAANLGRPGFLVEYVRTYHPELACFLPTHGRRFVYVK